MSSPQASGASSPRPAGQLQDAMTTFSDAVFEATQGLLNAQQQLTRTLLSGDGAHSEADVDKERSNGSDEQETDRAIADEGDGGTRPTSWTRRTRPTTRPTSWTRRTRATTRPTSWTRRTSDDETDELDAADETDDETDELDAADETDDETDELDAADETDDETDELDAADETDDETDELDAADETDELDAADETDELDETDVEPAAGQTGGDTGAAPAAKAGGRPRRARRPRTAAGTMTSGVN